MSTALWGIHPASFMAHDICGGDGADAPTAPLCLGCAGGAPPPTHDQIFIKLHGGIVPEFSRFQRLLEVVSGHHSTIQASRNDYGYYRERGYRIQTHKIN